MTDQQRIARDILEITKRWSKHHNAPHEEGVLVFMQLIANGQLRVYVKEDVLVWACGSVEAKPKSAAPNFEWVSKGLAH